MWSEEFSESQTNNMYFNTKVSQYYLRERKVRKLKEKYVTKNLSMYLRQ